jgi:polyphosphate kinase
MMPRNIDRRVEVLFPVEEQRFIRYLRDDVLETYLVSNVKTRQLKSDGSWKMLQPRSDEKPINVQNWLLNYYKK